MSDFLVFNKEPDREARKTKLMEGLKELRGNYLQEVLKIEEALIYAQTGEISPEKRQQGMEV